MLPSLFRYGHRRLAGTFTRAASTLPELTKDRYPHVKRGQYATLEDRHVNHFRDLLGETRVITDPSECQGYNVDWIRNVRGYSQCVLKPRTTEEVSAILSFCNAERLPVCPQGGNTGLVGGSVPVFDEIVLSTALMNQIISLDDASGVLVCQAGCVLETLENYLDEKNLIMPIDLGAKGSCHIGGNISTNAGGLRLLRYGNLHGNVLGVEAVKANGEIIDCLNVLKKDNTGYHLKHLFIGSEGTLGVLTKIALQCPVKPASYHVAFLGLESFEKVVATFQNAKYELNEIISAFELMDAQSMNMVETHLQLKSPIGSFPFYILIETAGANSEHNGEKLNMFLEKCLENDLILDGTVTGDPGKRKALWDIRERFGETLRFDGYVLLYDISFPVKKFYSIISGISKIMGNKCHRISGMGHLGDGNLHLQISLREYDQDIKKFFDLHVLRLVQELKGSFSAEHGIGFLKTEMLKSVKPEPALQLMKDMKKMMDPNGILNPYKVIN